MPYSACKNGDPANINTMTAGTKTAKGLFITPLAIFDQKPSSPASTPKENGTLNEFTLSPSKDRIAGSRTMDEVRATAVAQIPPHPNEGRPVFSKKSIPISPTMTVIPEKKIALPAVALVIAIAVLWSLPLPSSSLNLFTMKRE